jgi:hypothetical protein
MTPLWLFSRLYMAFPDYDPLHSDYLLDVDFLLRSFLFAALCSSSQP